MAERNSSASTAVAGPSASNNDEEFEYDFNETTRQNVHQQNFNNARMPSHLVSVANNQGLGSVVEGDESVEDHGDRRASIAPSDHTAKRSLWSERHSTQASSCGPPSTAASYMMQNISHIEPILTRRVPVDPPLNPRSSQDVQSVMTDVDEAFASQARESPTPEMLSSWSLFQPSENNYMTDHLTAEQQQPSISNMASAQLMRMLNAGGQALEGSWGDDSKPQEPPAPAPPARGITCSSNGGSASSSHVNIDANFISSLALAPPAAGAAAAGAAAEAAGPTTPEPQSSTSTNAPSMRSLGGPSLGSAALQQRGTRASAGADSSSFSGFLDSSAAAAGEDVEPEEVNLTANLWAMPESGSTAAGGQARPLDVAEVEVSMAGIVSVGSHLVGSGNGLEPRPHGDFDMSALVLAASQPQAGQDSESASGKAAVAEGAATQATGAQDVASAGADADAASGAAVAAAGDAEQRAAVADKQSEQQQAVQAQQEPTQAEQPEEQEMEVEVDDWESANKARQADLQQQAVAGAAATAEKPAADSAAAAQLAAPAYTAAEQHFVSLPIPAATKQELEASLPQPSGCLPCFARKPDPAARQQLLSLLGLAKLAFDDSYPQHTALLQAVHTAYTGSSAPAARFGAHWDALGFQGTDPATDLRGCGMLGLLHLLALQQHGSEAAARIYKLSRDPTHGFPMAIVSINITKWVLQAARAGSLAAAASKAASGGERALWRASVAMLAGCWYELFQRWLVGGKTMGDSGLVLKELQGYCLGNVSAMVQKGQAGRL